MKAAPRAARGRSSIGSRLGKKGSRDSVHSPLNLFPNRRDRLDAMPSNDELTLLRRVATKDRRAFEALYHLYYRRLFGYLLKLTRRADLVEEVLNDVMLAIWKGAASFDGRSRPSTWIFGIAYHKALKALARRPAAEVGGDVE